MFEGVHFSKINREDIEKFGGIIMRNLQAFLLLMSVLILLVGCGNTLEELKGAAAGINSRANEAATALSMDAHSIRATEIQYNNQTFTINDLYKAILRDVQWHYEKIDGVDTIKVTGTWQDKGLFEVYNFEEDVKNQLLEYGKITVFLTFSEDQLNEEATEVTMHLNDKILVQEIGTPALHTFYELYTSFKK